MEVGTQHSYKERKRWRKRKEKEKGKKKQRARRCCVLSILGEQVRGTPSSFWLEEARGKTSRKTLLVTGQLGYPIY